MLGRNIKHTCLFARLRPPAKRSSSSPSSSSSSVRPSASVLFSEYPEEDKEKSSVQRRTDVAARWRSLTCRRKSIRRSRPRRRGREEERRRGGERWSSQPGRRRGRGSEEGVGWQEGKVEDQSGEEDKCQGEEKGTPWGGCRRLHSVCVWWGKNNKRKQSEHRGQEQTWCFKGNTSSPRIYREHTLQSWGGILHSPLLKSDRHYISGGAATVTSLWFRVHMEGSGRQPSLHRPSGWGWNSSSAKRRKHVSK